MDWTVDYGEGAREITLPHVWHLEQPVTWEGPAVYQCQTKVPKDRPHLIFHGVSYQAEIFVNNKHIFTHQGIWDAFSADLSDFADKEISLKIKVIKNGGSIFPVKNVASGFLPYVYHTFGGIFRPTEWSETASLEKDMPTDQRVTINEGRIFVNNKPFYAKGILTWGWYPEIGSPHPSQKIIKKEVSQIKKLGFNLVKFCLWLPPHEYLHELERQGLMAWLELPIWLPNQSSLDSMKTECLQIGKQYKHHSNILAWTIGCELSEGIDPNWRKELVAEIQQITNHPLVKDNSGGAEMYGGHPAEFGTFDDFHPYCEPFFYPLVLNNLSPGIREKKPILLGEFNDADVFRPLHHLAENTPYWASSNPNLNDQGVRWQYDIPRIIEECKSTDLGDWLTEREESLTKSSLKQCAWMRKKAFENTKLHPEIDGWVLTGHRHTPISTAGVINDQGDEVFNPKTVQEWTEDTSLILIPRRTPPWINGGNRPGWEPTTIRFTGANLFQVAIHSVSYLEEKLEWRIPNLISGTCDLTQINPLETKKVGEFIIDLPAGVYDLNLKYGTEQKTISIRIIEPLENQNTDFIIYPDQTIPRSFFREACYSYEHPLWSEENWVDDFERFALVASDKTLSTDWLNTNHPNWQPLLIRLDTRTFERLPIVAVSNGKIITSLSPAGGLGNQPSDIEKNPAGHDLIRLFQKFMK